MTWPWVVLAGVTGLFGELVEMFEPSHRHVIEEQERRAADVVQVEDDEPFSPTERTDR